MDEMQELPGHGRKAVGAGAGVALFDQTLAHALDVLSRQPPGLPYVMVLNTRTGTRVLGTFVESVSLPRGTQPTPDDLNRVAAEYLRFAAETLAETAEHYEAKIGNG